jgi:hypothetical protein
MFADFSERVHSNKVPTLGAEMIYEPEFDPMEMKHKFINMIVRNFQTVFSYKEKGSIFGVFEKCCFFSVTEEYPISHRENGQVSTALVPLLKAVYVLPEHRNSGVQALHHVKQIVDINNELKRRFR